MNIPLLVVLSSLAMLGVWVWAERRARFRWRFAMGFCIMLWIHCLTVYMNAPLQRDYALVRQSFYRVAEEMIVSLQKEENPTILNSLGDFLRVERSLETFPHALHALAVALEEENKFAERARTDLDIDISRPRRP